MEASIMLVLSRKLGESIVIGNNIVVTITRIQGGRIDLGIEAPQDVTILRAELEVDAEKTKDEEAA